MFSGANWNDCPILSDISFNAFTNESKIEIHECNTAIGGDEYYFSVLIYLNLFELGKTKSVVIGHTTNTSPLINGSSTKTNEQSYMWFERAIHKNGKLQFLTKAKGFLDEEALTK